MDPKIKALWVASLRDGSFTQGRTIMRDLHDRYDPQGVLCELAVSAGVLGEAERYEKPHAAHFFGYQYIDPDSKQKSATGLPEAVQKWSGVPYHTGWRVAIMGDEGKTFAQIADWIEENL